MTNQLVPKPLPTERKQQLSSHHKHSPVPRILPASGYNPTPYKGPDFSSLLQGLFSQSSPTLFGRHTRSQAERWAFLEKRTSVAFCLILPSCCGDFRTYRQVKPFSLTSTVYDKSCILFSINSFIHIHCPYFICVC